MLTVNLCLSDIPADRFKTVQTKKGLKTFLNLVIVEKQKADDYGNTHYVAASKSKDERAADPTPLYCGDAKEIKTQQSGTPMTTNPWANPTGGQPQAQQQSQPQQGQTSYGNGATAQNWAQQPQQSQPTANQGGDKPDDLPF